VLDLVLLARLRCNAVSLDVMTQNLERHVGHAALFGSSNRPELCGSENAYSLAAIVPHRAACYGNLRRFRKPKTRASSE